jgi:hypothetical protein
MTFRTTEMPFKIETAEPKETADELQELRRKFILTLKGRVLGSLPGAIPMKQDGADRLFYIIHKKQMPSDPATGKTEEHLTVMRDDFMFFNVTSTATPTLGPGNVLLERCFKEDPTKAGLSGVEARKLVDRIIEGKK